MTRKRAKRTAIIAGATGLVGSELLKLLVASPEHERIHVLARRPLTERPDKAEVHVVDFSALGKLPRALECYICLGTTIKLAGSQAAFRKVDLDAVVAVARAAHDAGASRLAVVSALGADARSAVFYNRVKGEMEAAVQQLGYKTVAILRPSLLAGERQNLGQATRPGEQISLALLRPWARLIPRSFRPIEAGDVARTMIDALADPVEGLRIIESAAMQP